MDASHDIAVRSARDRLIDLLGIGDTCPLTDLVVSAVPPKVTHGGRSRVRIEDAQLDVGYQLLDPAGAPLGAAAAGSGDTLEIETPPVLENITFRVRAAKALQGTALAPQPPLLLDATAAVKVGLDTGLVVRFAEQPPWLPLPLLDPQLTQPQPSDPRLVPFGTAVRIEVEKSQEGVVYTLIVDGVEQPAGAQTGNRQTLTLATGPMHEDAVIQVRATKSFFGTAGTDTEALLARLFLKVMADPAPALGASPLIADFDQQPTVTIAATQASARYRVHQRAVADAEFLRDGAGAAGRITVPVEGKADVQVQAPQPVPAAGGAEAEGWLALGDAPLPGTGGELVVPLPAMRADTLFVVQALKLHRVVEADPLSPTIASSVWLPAAAMVLVRPDPARRLTLRVQMAEGRSGDTLQLEGGEPGVAYAFSTEPDGTALPLQGYFHQRDAADPAQNKGTGQLAVEVDYSLAAYAEPLPPVLADDRARLLPLPPQLDMAPLVAGTRLLMMAWKVMTGVEAKLRRQALLAAVPAAHAEPAVVDHGTAPAIVVEASDALDRYQLLRDGVPLTEAVLGTGEALRMVANVMVADAGFELVVTRAADADVRVERVVRLAVPVRPDTGLAVTAALAELSVGAGTEIVVQATQPGVRYRLQVAGTALGDAVDGTGAALALPTGPLTADTTFGVVATRSDQPHISATLAAQVVVTVVPV